MKKILIIAALCFLQNYECWSKSTLIINNQEVEKTSYRIEAEGTYLKFTFEDGTFITERMNAALIFFDAETGINNAIMPDIYKVREEVDGVLKIDGLKPGDKLDLYSANGSQLYSTTCRESSISVNVSNLKRGVYVVRVNKQSVKFIKK